MTDIYIKEIFQSINGEVCLSHQGSFATFIRMSGCNLRCRYCDSKYTWSKDEKDRMTVHGVCLKVNSFSCKNILITGGEPLYQREAFAELVSRLGMEGYSITVETNGAYPIPPLTRKFVDCWVVDYKLPGSGCEEAMDIENFYSLRQGDFVKFVVSSKEDFHKAVTVLNTLETLFYRSCVAPPTFAFSPSYDDMTPQELYELILQQKHLTNTILSLQIHKIYGFR